MNGMIVETTADAVAMFREAPKTGAEVEPWTRNGRARPPGAPAKKVKGIRNEFV